MPLAYTTLLMLIPTPVTVDEQAERSKERWPEESLGKAGQHQPSPRYAPLRHTAQHSGQAAQANQRTQTTHW